MAVFLLHGIADEPLRGVAAYRNYAPREAFEHYLCARQDPFSAWQPDGPRGDVLTVDDATRAGADACQLARALGHEVMFFINPYQVATGQPYCFSLLEAAFDARRVASADYFGRTYDLDAAAGVREFWLAARAALIEQPASYAYAAALEVCSLLGADGVQVAAHQRPLSLAELVALRDAGVRIENHGWSHEDLRGLSDDEFVEHVERGRAWLQREVGVEARLYAVPFGTPDVPAHRQASVANGYFLATKHLPRGRVSEHGWNRKDLLTEMHAQARLRAYLDARRPRDP